jgi:sec-independent protein translocase protein TatC
LDSNRLVIFIIELRKSILHLGIAIAGGTFVLYFLSPAIIQLLQGHLDQQLAFFRIAEPFIAHVKIAFLACLFLLVPWLAIVFWRALGIPFGLDARSRNWFVVFTCLLFYTGTLFSYLITLPFGVNFLLGFQTEQLQPVIAIDRFVNFVTLFILGFGIIFELPLFMVFAARVGICPRTSFERNRRYAVLAITIAAALLTPTPDAVNMLLMAGPLYLLYELGIIIMRIMKIC